MGGCAYIRTVRHTQIHLYEIGAEFDVDFHKNEYAKRTLRSFPKDLQAAMEDPFPNLARMYLPLLANTQPLVRRQACMILLGTYGKRALTYVRRLINDSDPEVRQNARLALLAMAEITDLGMTFQPFRGMYLQCLGRMRVYMDNHEIHAQNWAQADHGRAGWQKVQGVFAYLIHSGRRGATRAAIGTAVWGGPFSVSSLSRTFTTLRQTLGRACGPAFVEQALLITDDYCVLDPAYYHTDMQLFEHTFDAAVRMEQESGLESAVPIYSQAVHLYGGPYMADVPRGSGWSLHRRDSLMNRFIIAAERIAEYTYGQRQYKQCIALCTAALDADDTADTIIVWLMRAYAQEGRQAELEQVYRRYAHTAKIEPGQLATPQNPVVQVYQSLGKGRMMNNSSF
jgi:DNA-binding SARP family transcriptional activator